jgi:hypothetical protein
MPSGFALSRSAFRDLHDDRQDRGPARGLGELAIFVSALTQATRKLSGDARMTLETSTATCCRPTRVKGSLERA